jgi:hypothetical protein
MKIIKNEKLIKRKGTIGNWMNLGAIAILGGALYVTFTNQTNSQMILYSYIALFAGLILMQVGMYLGIRYGRSPRPDEKLDAGLKGLPGDYTLYHYTTPASHLLVGPAGVWLLMPYHQRGEVTYHKNRWRISGGGALQAYMRIFGQEGMGRPDAEIDSELRNIRRHFAKQMDESAIPEIRPLMIFTSDDVQIDAEDAPVPALKLKQVKDFLRQKAKEYKLSAENIQNVNAALGQE